MPDIVVRIAWQCWAVLGQMSPYLLFGFLMAGVLSVCISPAFVERHLGGRGFGPVLKAALFGVPLPLCSCSVIPVSASFRRHGASRAAVTSFLLSTPQTGIDSILITYALLGLTFAVYRPVVAMATGLLGGFLVMFFVQSNGKPAPGMAVEGGAKDGAAEIADGSAPPPNHACCCHCEAAQNRSVFRRTIEYGFLTLPRDIGPALLLGVVVAGAISALVQPNQLQPYLGGGILSIILMMALGVPIYVCASASVPIAVGLIHLGASPGAALAFLIAGPASNAATLTTIWKVMGGRTVFLYLITIVISAVAAGLTLDWIHPALPAITTPCGEHSHGAAAGGWISTCWAMLLLAVLTFSYVAKIVAPRAFPEGDERVE